MLKQLSGNEQEENSGPSPEDQPFSSEGEKALEQARAVGVSFYSGVIPRVIYFTAIGIYMCVFLVFFMFL